VDFEDDNGCEDCSAKIADDVRSNLISEEGNISAEVKVFLNNEGLADILNQKIQDKISVALNQVVENRVNSVLRNVWNDDLNRHMKTCVESVVEKRFNELHPEVVDDKVDAMLKHLKEYRIDGNRFQIGGKSISVAIQDRFNSYLDNEFKEIVSKTKNNIDEFAQNYFTKNLFRAMGLMSNFTDEEAAKKLGK